MVASLFGSSCSPVLLDVDAVFDFAGEMCALVASCLGRYLEIFESQWPIARHHGPLVLGQSFVEFAAPRLGGLGVCLRETTLVFL